MSVTVTEEQRRAIDTQGRIIVSASAGSGKTFVMIERLVSLILSGTDVGSVLCVTFTNKAAAQMRERLRLALLKKIGETDGDERRRLKEQLKALPLADISTIHAFCGRLVRTHFFLTDADPSFRIIAPDQADGNALSSRALEEAFEDAYTAGDEDFMNLLGVYFRKKKDTRLKKIVLSLYSAARETADYRKTLSQIAEKREAVDGVFEEACNYLAEDFRERAQFISDGAKESGKYFAGNKRAEKVCETVAAACAPILGAEELFGMTEAAQTTPSIATMPGKTQASGEELKALKFLSELSKAIKELYKELRSYATREEESARYGDARRRAAALAALALKYDDIFSRLKREANVLDYNDLEHFALAILENGDACRELKEKYRYLFVDEYQDINPLQERILSRLSDENVFLVGDAKQAIYGFRGSRSEYFEQKELELEHLRLTSNFRSAEAVLEAVNRVFAPLIPSYAPMRGGERYHGERGSVHFRYIPKAERETREHGVYSVLEGRAEEEPDALAEAVAHIVYEELGSEWYDADEGCVKRVRFGDIAILARKNSGDAERIVSALARCGIPVSASTKVNVCDFFEARLLLDWLSFLDNAEQDIPYATALLSAIGGLTDTELAKVRLRFPSPYTFRAACAEYRSKMRDGVSEKLDAFERTADRLRSLAQVRTAAEMLNELLFMGLEAQIAAKQGGKDRLSRVRRLIAEAEGAGSVHAFLARLKAAEYRVDFSESGGENAVKVLTMHAAKGLEYPIVITVSMDCNFHGADRGDVMWTEKFLAAPKSYDMEKRVIYDTVLRRASAVYEERRELKEERNLLYVAMTRARCRLYMLFEEREHALSPAYAKRFSDFIDFAACAEYFDGQADSELPPVERKALAYLPDEELVKRILSVYRRPYAHEESVKLPAKSSATDLLRSERRLPSPKRASEGEGFTTQTGIAYHAFLQHVEFGKEADGELARMRERGLLSEEQIALLELSQLKAILEIPCLKNLAGKRVLREQTFLVSLRANEIWQTEATDEIVFQGAIDLICMDENGVTIIDYKYSSHDDERIATDYVAQIKLYKKAVARIMRIGEQSIAARIVNIAKGREIAM